eukprot:Em0004g1331a
MSYVAGTLSLLFLRTFTITSCTIFWRAPQDLDGAYDNSSVVVAGSVIQLFCSASGQLTAPNIQWTRNNITIPETAQLPHLMVKSRTQNNTITSSLLTIYGFSSSDKGSYQCVACDNNSCNTSMALLLSASSGSNVLKIVRELSNNTADRTSIPLGSSDISSNGGFLRCSAEQPAASSLTAPSMMWLKDGTQLFGDGVRVVITTTISIISASNRTVSFVRIFNFSQSDAGVYQCVFYDTPSQGGEVITTRPYKVDTGPVHLVTLTSAMIPLCPLVIQVEAGGEYAGIQWTRTPIALTVSNGELVDFQQTFCHYPQLVQLSSIFPTSTIPLIPTSTLLNATEPPVLTLTISAAVSFVGVVILLALIVPVVIFTVHKWKSRNKDMVSVLVYQNKSMLGPDEMLTCIYMHDSSANTSEITNGNSLSNENQLQDAGDDHCYSRLQFDMKKPEQKVLSLEHPHLYETMKSRSASILTPKKQSRHVYVEVDPEIEVHQGSDDGNLSVPIPKTKSVPSRTGIETKFAKSRTRTKTKCATSRSGIKTKFATSSTGIKTKFGKSRTRTNATFRTGINTKFPKSRIGVKNKFATSRTGIKTKFTKFRIGVWTKFTEFRIGVKTKFAISRTGIKTNFAKFRTATKTMFENLNLQPSSGAEFGPGMLMPKQSPNEQRPTLPLSPHLEKGIKGRDGPKPVVMSHRCDSMEGRPLPPLPTHVERMSPSMQLPPSLPQTCYSPSLSPLPPSFPLWPHEMKRESQQPSPLCLEQRQNGFPSIKSPQIQVSPRDSSRKAKRKTAGLPPNTIQISQSVSKMEPFGSLPDSHVSESPYSYVTRDELKVIVKLSQTQCHSASNSPMSQKKFRQEDSSKTNTLTRSQSLTFILDQ